MTLRVDIPAGNWLDYGGTFEQLQSAATRMQWLVPLTLLMIFGLLFMTFGSVRDGVVIISHLVLMATHAVLHHAYDVIWRNAQNPDHP